jgi:hypothetical protein
VHETRARFDVLMEKPEPPTSYNGKEVWAPPLRIWGDGPRAQRNWVAKSPWWRPGTDHRTVPNTTTGGAARDVAKSIGTQAAARATVPEDRVPKLQGLGSMDRLHDLGFSGFRGMLDSMGRRAFGGDWESVRSDVASWYDRDRVCAALPAMTQHSPLTRNHLSGPNSKTKVSLTADFEQLTYDRVINPLSSSNMQVTESFATTTDHNRQDTKHAALGGNGGPDNTPILGEVVGGTTHIVRHNDRLRNDRQVAVETKFDQPMAIFKGWVRLDATMTGSKATVHESGLFPVEIAIPLTELQGSRTHNAELPPTFTRDAPTGFVDYPSPQPAPDSDDPAHSPDGSAVDATSPPANRLGDSKSGYEVLIKRMFSRPQPRPRPPRIAIDLEGFSRLNSGLSSIPSFFAGLQNERPDAIELSPRSASGDAGPHWVDSPIAGSSPIGSRVASPEPWEGRTRQSTDERANTTPPLVPGVPRTDSLPSRGDTLETRYSAGTSQGWQSTLDSMASLIAGHQEIADIGPLRQEAGPWTTPGLTDAADGTAPPPREKPAPPNWEWTPKPGENEPPEPPVHALVDSWHPSDMLVGVDPESGLLEAIRHDLEPAIGSSLEDAMESLSDHFGPRVLAARLTHESGQEWSHDIPVTGGKITVKVRPVRLPDAKYIGTSKAFDNDVSIGSQSSTAHTHGAPLRTVAGGRIGLPIPQGSVTVELTHTASTRPQEDIKDQSFRGLRGVSTRTGDVGIRDLVRVRTTEEHSLFRQPIRFHIGYEQHLGRRRLQGIPESPRPVRLDGIFSYPKAGIPTASTASSAREGRGVDIAAAERHLEVDQIVVKVRPHTGLEPAAHRAGPGDGRSGRTPKEDLVAAHVLDSMTANGEKVFGEKWPAVRAELAPHLKTISIQRDLGDYSRGATTSIDLESVPGGKVVLRARLDTMDAADSKAITDFYIGGRRSTAAAVSNNEFSGWRGFVQPSAQLLPGSKIVNLSLLGRLTAFPLVSEKADTRTDSSATGMLLRKRVPTLTHVGTATVVAEMSRPPGLSRLGDTATGRGMAQVDFTTRESPTDDQAHQLYLPRDGIIQQSTDAPTAPSDGRHNERGEDDGFGPPARGLSHDSIVRRITDGNNFRARTLNGLRALGITSLDGVVEKYLTAPRLAQHLSAMTRVAQGDGVELLRHENFVVTGRADVLNLRFIEIDHENTNANILNDVNQAKLVQRITNRELDLRALLGPHFGRSPRFQGSVLFGAGISRRQRFETFASQVASVSANGKFARSYAVFDATTRITLTVHDRGTPHGLQPIDVHGPILIPESETRPVDLPPEPTDSPPDEPGASATAPGAPGPHAASQSAATADPTPRTQNASLPLGGAFDGSGVQAPGIPAEEHDNAASIQSARDPGTTGDDPNPFVGEASDDVRVEFGRPLFRSTGSAPDAPAEPKATPPPSGEEAGVEDVRDARERVDWIFGDVMATLPGAERNAVAQAYRGLSEDQRRRPVPAVVQMVVNTLLTGDPDVRLRGGSSGSRSHDDIVALESLVHRLAAARPDETLHLEPGEHTLLERVQRGEVRPPRALIQPLEELGVPVGARVRQPGHSYAEAGPSGRGSSPRQTPVARPDRHLDTDDGDQLQRVAGPSDERPGVIAPQAPMSGHPEPHLPPHEQDVPPRDEPASTLPASSRTAHQLSRDEMAQVASREDYDRGVAAPPAYVEAAPPPPYPGYPADEPLLGPPPAPRPEAFASTVAEVRRRLKASFADLLPDNIDDWIVRTYDVAYMQLPAALQQNYVQSGWSPRLLRELDYGVRAQLGLLQGPAGEEQFVGQQSLRVGGPAGLPPDPVRFASLVAHVHALLNDKFRSVPADVDDLIAIAYEALPEDARDGFEHGWERRAALGVYGALKEWLRQQHTGEHWDWRLRRLRREAKDFSPEPGSTSQFGIPERQPAEPRPAEPRPAHEWPAKSPRPIEVPSLRGRAFAKEAVVPDRPDSPADNTRSDVAARTGSETTGRFVHAQALADGSLAGAREQAAGEQTAVDARQEPQRSSDIGREARAIETPEQLSEVIDDIAGPDRVVPGVDDPREDPRACTVLLGEAMRALYPDRRAVLPATRLTLDDSVLDGRPVGRLIGGAEPAPITSWDELDRRLREAGGEGGSATALILVQHANAMGHAVGAHLFADGRIAYFDLHGAPGQRVSVGNRPNLSLARASAVIVDGAGNEVPHRAEASSLVDALIDPVGDPRYGRGGIEAEYHGGYLELPAAMFDPRTQHWTTAAVSLRQQVPSLATNQKLGLKVTIGFGAFRLRPDGQRAMEDQSAQAGGEVVYEPILEFVTDPPIAELPKEATASGAAVKALRRQLGQLDGTRAASGPAGGPALGLAEILPKAKGWQLSEAAANVTFHPVRFPEAATATSKVHHTKGMPLGAVARFMRAIGDRIYDQQRREFHNDGQAFAQSVVRMFEQRPTGATRQAPADPSDPESRALEGAMWLTYVHVAALVRATLLPGRHIAAKHFSAVALRQSLSSVRNELSPQVQNFLNDNAETIRAMFETHFLTRIPDFSTRYADAHLAASLKPDFQDLQIPPLADGTQTTPLQAVRYASPVETHDRHALTARDYLDTMLLAEAEALSPQQAFGVREHFAEPDRAGHRRLLLLELRTDTRPLHTPEQIVAQYKDLTTTAREAVKAVEPSPTPSVARAARAFIQLLSSRRRHPDAATSELSHVEDTRPAAERASSPAQPARAPGPLRRRPSFHPDLPIRDESSDSDRSSELSGEEMVGRPWSLERSRLGALPGEPAGRGQAATPWGSGASRGLPVPPAQVRPLAAIPHADTTIEDIGGWIGDINHDGDPDAARTEARSVNCGPATVAVFHRLAGIPSNARANLGELTPDDIGAATGLALVPNTSHGIARSLSGEGPGAFTVVAVRYRDGQQHAFIAFFDGERVYALDGQNGTTKAWPPPMDRDDNPVQAWFMGTPVHGDRSIFANPDATTDTSANRWPSEHWRSPEHRAGPPQRSALHTSPPDSGSAALDEHDELVTESIPDYVLARFGLTESSPGQWVLGEVQSPISPAAVRSADTVSGSATSVPDAELSEPGDSTRPDERPRAGDVAGRTHLTPDQSQGANPQAGASGRALRLGQARPSGHRPGHPDKLYVIPGQPVAQRQEHAATSPLRPKGIGDAPVGPRRRRELAGVREPRHPADPEAGAKPAGDKTAAGVSPIDQTLSQRERLEDRLATIFGQRDAVDNCVLRLEVLRAGFYGPAAVTRDDLALGSVRREDALAAALSGVWQPVDHSLNSVIDKLNTLGPGSTAFILTSPGTKLRQPHGYALRNENGELLWIETQDEAGSRVRPLADIRLEHSTDARVIVADPAGLAVPLTENILATASTINSLLDPSLQRRYERAGIEIETGFGLINQWHEYHDRTNETLVKGRTWGLVFDRATGTDDESKLIFEIVSQPAAVLDSEKARGSRDGAVDRDDVFREIRDVLRRLSDARPGATVDDIFYGVEGVTAPSLAVGQWKVHKVIPGLMRARYTVGVPLAAMHQFMQFVAERTFVGATHPVLGHVRSALKFGNAVATKFVGLPENDSPTFDRLVAHDRELAELRGFMAAVYTQVAANVHFRIERPENQLRKNYALIASRTSLQGMRASLPESVKTWLDTNYKTVERMFEERFAEDNPRLAQEATTRLPGGMLSAQLRSTESHTARDYLENATRQRPRVVIDQYRGLGIRTRFREMDGDLGVFELRGHNQENYTSIDEVEHAYDEIERKVRALYSSMLPSDQERPGVSDGRLFYLEPFAERVKTLTEQQKAQIRGFASYVADQAARRLATGKAGLVLRVEGGGNDGVRLPEFMASAVGRDPQKPIFGDGAREVGLQRARAALDVLREAVVRQLQIREVPEEMVRFTEPTSRVDWPRKDIPFKGKAEARVVVMTIAYDTPGGQWRGAGAVSKQHLPNVGLSDHAPVRDHHVSDPSSSQQSIAPVARNADTATPQVATTERSADHRDQSFAAQQSVRHAPQGPSDATTVVARRADDGSNSGASDARSGGTYRVLQEDDPRRSTPGEPETQRVSHDLAPRPGDDPEMRSSAKAEELKTNIAAIRAWLKDVNNHATNVQERKLNCGQTTIAVFDRLSGRDSFQTASPLAGILKTQLQDVTGFAPQRTSLQGIEQILRSQGSGAHAVVFVARRGPDNAASSHTFNAFFDGKDVYAIDGQDASIQKWPPKFDLDDHKPVEWSIYAPPESVPPLDEAALAEFARASASGFHASDVAYGSHGPAEHAAPHHGSPSSAAPGRNRHTGRADSVPPRNRFWPDPDRSQQAESSRDRRREDDEPDSSSRRRRVGEDVARRGSVRGQPASGLARHSVERVPWPGDRVNESPLEKGQPEGTRAALGRFATAASAEDSGPGGSLTAGAHVGSVVGAWNDLAATDQPRAQWILADARGLLTRAGFDDPDEAIKRGYGALTPEERARNVRDVANMLHNHVLTGHRYAGPRGGAHAEELEVHNVGLWAPSGERLEAKLVLLTSVDRAVKVVSDSLTVTVGADGKFYESREGRSAAGVDAHPTQPKRVISVPEIVTNPTGTLTGEPSRISMNQLVYHRTEILTRLGQAAHAYGSGGRTTRLGDLFPPDSGYEVTDGFGDVQVSYYPDLYDAVPFYVQHTEDVALAGIYPFMENIAGNSRGFVWHTPLIENGLLFGRDVAAEIVYAQTGVRPSAEDIQLLVASEPLVSVMGVMALTYTHVAALLQGYLDRRLAKNILLVASRHPLWSLSKGLDVDMREQLRRSAAAIERLFADRFSTQDPRFSRWNLMDTALFDPHDVTIGTVRDMLADVMDPADEPLVEPAEVFEIGSALAGDDLNERADGRPPTVAVEVRSYGQPKIPEPVQLRYNSDYAMVERDSEALIRATQRIDEVATTARVLYRDVGHGRGVVTALTNVATATSEQRQYRIGELRAAIERYLEHNPAMTAGLADLLAPASHRLGVQLVRPTPHPGHPRLGVTPGQEPTEVSLDDVDVAWDELLTAEQLHGFWTAQHNAAGGTT